MKSPLRKNMGKKNCEFTAEIRSEIMRLFLEMEENEVSKIFNNEEFGFWSVTVERPLRLMVHPENRIPAGVFKKDDELKTYKAAIDKLPEGTPLDDWEAFSKATKLKAAILKKVRPYITEKDRSAKPVKGEADSELRSTEIIPFTYNGGIEQFLVDEVKPYAADAWIDEKSVKIGYELSFIKYFYKPTELRNMEDIVSDLVSLENVTDGMMHDILEGLKG